VYNIRALARLTDKYKITSAYQGLTQVGTALDDGSGGYLVPIRAIYEAIGCTLTWEDSTKTVHVFNNGAEVYAFTVGSSVHVLIGKAANGDLGGPVVIVNGKAYAPATNLSNMFKINSATLGVYMKV
jgi:hypothetical protein